MNEQFIWIKLNEKDDYEVLVRPRRLNQGSNPLVPSTIGAIQGGSHIMAMRSMEELAAFTKDYLNALYSGDTAVVLNTHDGSARMFIWVDGTVRWQEIQLNKNDAVDPNSHKHSNFSLLESLSQDSEHHLLLEGVRVGNDLSFTNKDVLDALSVDSDNKLLIDGVRVGNDLTFSNKDVLDELHEEADGNLTFKGQLIKGGGGGSTLQGIVQKFADLTTLGTPEEGWLAIVKQDENNGNVRSTYIYHAGKWNRMGNVPWTFGNIAPTDTSLLWVDISGSSAELKWWNGIRWESLSGGTAGAVKNLQGFTANNYYAFGEMVFYAGQIYSAKRSFTSDASINLNDWDLVGGDMRRSIYDKDMDGIVDRAEFADVAQLALETVLVQSWKPNTAYTSGMQLVYLNEIYTVKANHTSGATFADSISNLDLTATGHHYALWDLQGGNAAAKQFYHLTQPQHALLTRFNEVSGKLQFDVRSVGDMDKAVYDKNNDGVVDKASTLDGLQASISELSYSKGLKGNIQSQLDSMTHGMVFKGFANTYADIANVIPAPIAGDTIIVNADERHENLKTFYTHSGTGWTYLGPFNTSTRDFAIAPVQLGTEVAGILVESMIDPAIARVSQTHVHTNLTLLDTYTQTEADLADAVSKKHQHRNQNILDSYTQTNLDLSNAVAKMHSHSNLAVLDYFAQDSGGNLIWKGAPIQSGGGSGGITSLSSFTTNDLRDSLNKRYVSDADRNNLALVPGIINDLSSINTTLSTIRSGLPANVSASNMLVSDAVLSTRLSSLKFAGLSDVDAMKPAAFLMTNTAGNRVTYRTTIQDLIKIQKVTDKSGTVFTDVPSVSFNSLNGRLLQNGTLELSQPTMFSTDLADMPSVFENGKLLVANQSTMKYELKDIADLTNSKVNFAKVIGSGDWTYDGDKGLNMSIVQHNLNSTNLIVAFYNASNESLVREYKILNENQILVMSSTSGSIKVVVNCSQGAAGNGTGTGGGGVVTTSDFIDDSRVRTDKTYSSQAIVTVLGDYAKRSTVLTRSESDARYSLKGTEHTHGNIVTLDKFSEDLSGNILYGGKKLLTEMKPFFLQKQWNNEKRSNLEVIMNVADIYNAEKYTAIMNSEFTVRNMIPSVDEVTDANNKLQLVVSDGTLVILDVQVAPGTTQKYLLGISPNLKIMIRGEFSANYYITAY